MLRRLVAGLCGSVAKWCVEVLRRLVAGLCGRVAKWCVEVLRRLVAGLCGGVAKWCLTLVADLRGGVTKWCLPCAMTTCCWFVWRCSKVMSRSAVTACCWFVWPCCKVMSRSAMMASCWFVWQCWRVTCPVPSRARLKSSTWRKKCILVAPSRQLCAASGYSDKCPMFLLCVVQFHLMVENEGNEQTFGEKQNKTRTT